MICEGRPSRCFRKQDARTKRSQPSRATRSRRCTGFWNATSRELAGWPSEPSSISRTHREQSLQTSCKRAVPPHPRERENVTHNNDLAGAPEEIRTPDPQIRSLVLYPAELRARFSQAFPGAGPSDAACIRQRFQRSRKRAIATGSGPAWQGPPGRRLNAILLRKLPCQAPEQEG